MVQSGWLIKKIFLAEFRRLKRKFSQKEETLWTF
jgi:hypothetical protein